MLGAQGVSKLTFDCFYMEHLRIFKFKTFKSKTFFKNRQQQLTSAKTQLNTAFSFSLAAIALLYCVTVKVRFSFTVAHFFAFSDFGKAPESLDF